MTTVDIITPLNKTFREHRRYTGDGLPNPPSSAPLPVGDPSSGIHNPSKSDIRGAFAAVQVVLQAAADAAEQIAFPAITPTWAALVATPGVRGGQMASVPTADTGTHTDPVAGGTVPNSGTYSWSVSPAGWRRVDVYQDVAFTSALAADAKLDAERVQLARLAETRGWPFKIPSKGFVAIAESSPASLATVRAGTAIRINVRGLYESVAANALQHSYVVATGAYRGIKLEPGRTNKALYSRDLSNAYWTKARVTIETPVLGPDGLISAQRIMETTENGVHAVTRTDNVTAGQIETRSYVVAPIGARDAFIQFDGVAEGGGSPSIAIFNLSGNGSVSSFDGIIQDPRITKLQNGFFLIEAGALPSATGAMRSFVASMKAGGASFAGEVDCGLAHWHTQHEVGRFATTPIPTTNAIASRPTTSLKGPVADARSGTVAVRFTVDSLPAPRARIAGLYADENNRIHLSVWDTGAIQLGYKLNGVTGTIDGPTIAAGSEVRASFTYRNGAQYLAVNGVLYTAFSPVAQDLLGAAHFVVGSFDGAVEPAAMTVSEAVFFAQPHDAAQTLVVGSAPGEPAVLVATHHRVEIASDPSKDMTLVWHAAASAPAAVEYRALGSTSWMSAGAMRKDLPVSTDKVCFATVTGLSPETIYEWRAAESGTAGIRRFRTLPAYLARDLRVAVVSDWQRDSAEALSPTSHFNVLNNLIASRQADLVLLVGDYAGDDGATSSTLTQRWCDFIQGYASRFIDADGCLIPACAVAGNHEAGLTPGQVGGSWYGTGTYGYMDRLFSTFYRKGATNSSGKGYGWFEIGSELLCVGLETNHGTPFAPQVAWLSQLLAAKASQFRHVIVFGHMGPVSLDNSSWTHESHRMVREQIAPIIQSYQNSRFLLHGHLHNLLATRKVKFVENPAGGVNAWAEHADGIRAIGAGGWSSPDYLPFNAQDQASDGTLGDGSVLVQHLVASNQPARNVTPISSPNNTTTDPATKHFWLLTLAENTQTAEAISLSNTELISFTETVT